MKRIILTVATVFAIGFANAQETSTTTTTEKESYGMKKGDMWAEGAFKVISSKASSDPAGKTSDYSFTPKIGWMRDDKFGWGGYLNIYGTKFNNDDKNSKYGIGVFARWYGLSLGERKSFNAYTELGVGYTSETNNPAVGDSDTDGRINAHIDLGMNYFLTKNWAVVFTISNIVGYHTPDPTTGSSNDDVTVNINLFNNPFAQSQFGLLYRW